MTTMAAIQRDGGHLSIGAINSVNKGSLNSTLKAQPVALNVSYFRNCELTLLISYSIDVPDTFPTPITSLVPLDLTIAHQVFYLGDSILSLSLLLPNYVYRH